MYNTVHACVHMLHNLCTAQNPVLSLCSCILTGVVSITEECWSATHPYPCPLSYAKDGGIKINGGWFVGTPTVELQGKVVSSPICNLWNEMIQSRGCVCVTVSN